MTMELEHLSGRVWTTPKDYYGHNPVGEYVLYSRHRDSDCLENANYDAFERDMLAIQDGVEETPDVDDSDAVFYGWTANHWAVGWVEYLMLKPDAPKPLLDLAESILERYSNYPCLDDELWSNYEWEKAQESWANMSLGEKVDFCKEQEITIFAARHTDWPSGYDDNGSIQHYLIGA